MWVGSDIVSLKEFPPYAIPISDDLTDIDEMRYHAGIICAMCSVLPFINRSWHLEGDRNPQIVQDLTRKQDNIEFVQKLVLDPLKLQTIEYNVC